MDPNWFLSAEIQSVGAMVAIIGGLIINDRSAERKKKQQLEEIKRIQEQKLKGIKEEFPIISNFLIVGSLLSEDFENLVIKIGQEQDSFLVEPDILRQDLNIEIGITKVHNQLIEFIRLVYELIDKKIELKHERVNYFHVLVENIPEELVQYALVSIIRYFVNDRNYETRVIEKLIVSSDHRLVIPNINLAIPDFQEHWASHKYDVVDWVDRKYQKQEILKNIEKLSAEINAISSVKETNDSWEIIWKLLTLGVFFPGLSIILIYFFNYCKEMIIILNLLNFSVFSYLLYKLGLHLKSNL